MVFALFLSSCVFVGKGGGIQLYCEKVIKDCGGM